MYVCLCVKDREEESREGGGYCLLLGVAHVGQRHITVDWVEHSNVGQRLCYCLLSVIRAFVAVFHFILKTLIVISNFPHIKLWINGNEISKGTWEEITNSSQCKLSSPSHSALKMFDMSFFTGSNITIFTDLVNGVRDSISQMAWNASFRWIILQFVYNASKQKHPPCYSIHLRMDTITSKSEWHKIIGLFHPGITVQ